MKEKLSLKRICDFAVLAVMGFFFVTVLIRFFTRQLLVERLGINNAFTSAVFFDAGNLNDADAGSADTEVYIDWEARYPFEYPDNITVLEDTPYTPAPKASITDKYVNKVFDLENSLETYSMDYLVGHDLFTKSSTGYDRLLQWKDPIRPDDFNRIITMEDGYLTYVQPEVEPADIEAMADSVSSFKEYLDSMNIPFIYINSGSKVCPEDYRMSDYEALFEHTNDNGDHLLKALGDRGIDTIDMRWELINEGIDWYGGFYKTDHHWTTETALKVARLTASRLNAYGFNYDLSKFDEENFEMTVYKNCFLGGQGRAVNQVKALPEDYTLILPKFETDLTIDIENKGLKLNGPYEESMIDMERLNEALAYTESDFLSKPDIYNALNMRNYPLEVFTNNLDNSNPDKTILIIADSFSWYPVSYMTLDTGRIVMLYPIAFTGSIRSAVKQINPSIVIMAACEKAINPIDYTTHESYFDLR